MRSNSSCSRIRSPLLIFQLQTFTCTDLFDLLFLLNESVKFPLGGFSVAFEIGSTDMDCSIVVGFVYLVEEQPDSALAEPVAGVVLAGGGKKLSWIPLHPVPITVYPDYRVSIYANLVNFIFI